MHICAKCKKKKVRKAFSPNKRYKSGLSSYCRACLHEHYYNPERDKIKERIRRMAKLGLTLEEADTLLEQNPVCQICSQPASGRNERLCIDHCHTTGAIRGVLCTRCNAWIGWLKDDSSLIEAAQKYLTGFAERDLIHDTPVGSENES